MDFITIATLTEQTLFITPRMSGQVVRFGGVDTVTTAEKRVRVAGSGPVEVSSGWWDDLIILAGAWGDDDNGFLTKGDLWYVLDPANPARVIGVKVWNGLTWADYQIVADSVIVPGSVGTIILADGAITAPKIAADSVEAVHVKAGSLGVDKVTPAFGQDLDISAAGAILLVVGQQADLSQQTTDTAAGLATQQRYLRFDVAQGLVLGATDDPAQLRLRNTGAALTVNGVELSTWEAGQMTVPSLKAEKVILGNHQLEKSGARTVMRAL